MQYVGKVFSTVSQLYKELNPATLSGAIDVVVVEDKEGNLSCSPFHVRFGKLQLLRPSDKAVQVIVNGGPAEFYMKVGDSGEAFFVVETEADVPSRFVTSPVASPALSFRDADDPDFLDLSGSVSRAPGEGVARDGYVSAPSAHGSESGSDNDDDDDDDDDDGDGDGDDNGDDAGNDDGDSDRSSGSRRHRSGLLRTPSSRLRLAGSALFRDRGDADDCVQSDSEAQQDIWLQRRGAPGTPGGGLGASSVVFSDDMSVIRSRRSERYLERVNEERLLAIAAAAAAAAAADTEGEESGGVPGTIAAAGSSANVNSGGGAARPMSIVSDSAYELGAFAGSKSGSAAIDSEDSDDGNRNGANKGRDERLHSEWDWGVQLTPSTQAVSRPAKKVHTATKSHTGAVASGEQQSLKHILDVTGMLASAAEGDRSQPVLGASLCGVDVLQRARDSAMQRRVFEESRVQAQAFSADPIGVLTNPRLVFQQESGEYVQGEALVLALVSQLAYGVPFDRGLQRVTTTTDGAAGRRVDGDGQGVEQAPRPVVSMPGSLQKPGEQRELVDGAMSDDAAVAITVNDEPERQEGRQGADVESQREHQDQDQQQQQQSLDQNRSQPQASTPSKQEGRRWWRWGQRTPAAATAATATAASAKAELSGSDAATINMPPVVSGTEQGGASSDFSGDEAGMAAGYMSDDGVLAHPLRQPLAQRPGQHHPLRYAKTLRLTSEQLKSLNLKYGANEIKFLVPSNNAYCEAKAYLYKWDTQIVISDIDGTITKSDALGHLFNMVGKDWTHHGVAKLFTDIVSNGYEILYLTSRAIGQADGTRDFLANVKQGDYRLPGGPLLLSPDRLFTSFHREVIMKRPQEFKMACLRDIRNLFGDQQSPFYAGFGNRITDAMSYRSVNVPVSRICTIDSYGEIKLDLLPGYRSSYVKINDLVDMMFPPLSSKLDPTYNDWEYWKRGLPEIEDELAEIDAMLAAEEEREKEAQRNKKKASPAKPSAALTTTTITTTSSSSPPLLLPRDSSGYTRTARSASNASSSPIMRHQLPDERLAGIRPVQQVALPSYQHGGVRQRADSWTTTTTSSTTVGSGSAKTMDLLSGSARDALPGSGVAGRLDNEPSLVNGTAQSNRMSLLKKASSAFSPFSLVRGSSPPPPPALPSSGSANSKYDQDHDHQQLSSSTDEQLSSSSANGGAFSQLLPASQKPKYVSAASTFSYPDDLAAEEGVASGRGKQEGDANLLFNFAGMGAADADMVNARDGEDDDDLDPLVAVAAAKLVPQFGERRIKSNSGGGDGEGSSRASVRSSEYSDEEDVDTDIDDEDDDDEPIDQEMLDIMHDMEQVQRLE
ncbi:lipin Ned1 [Coemansia sp. RSA 2599]|nr:lipin Ned1 [Coemansia sp. RSA 2598]KAJ1828766.1 lipin Ned1 [Coemansia sp. RSA 2599]